ncbi:IS30 family transposase [Akkermansiaceae bacterium]|nr:IS30 family transposase [Akkermansiaceae bacterium]
MPYQHLTYEERHTIFTLRRNGSKPSQIALQLCRHVSTINRELRRNVASEGEYQYRKAHTLAQERSRQAQCRAKRCSPKSWAFVVNQLCSEQWSPEQIRDALPKHNLERISHETIYARIYEDKRQGGTLHQHLRHKVKSYKNRSLQNDRRGQIKGAVSIEERPEVVDQRARIGDWELDTVIGKASGAVLVTMVERYSRFTIIAKAASKSADHVSMAIMSRLVKHRGKLHTLTFDNGKEFAAHAVIDAILDCQSYFAHPYSSWERGLNENTNGLIRQYFPKKTDFDQINEEQIAEVESKLNRRPRKCLDTNTPNEVFFSN